MKKTLKNAQPIIVKSVGAVGAGYLTKLVPFGNDQVKAGLAAAAGLFLSSQKGVIGQIGEGMAIGGVMKLAQSFGIGDVNDGPVFDFDIAGTQDGGMFGIDQDFM